MIRLKEMHGMPELLRWRAEVITEVFGQEPDAELLEANRRYYEMHIADGSHAAFVAERRGVEVGCGAVCFTDELPSPDNPTGRCAYLMNIYVRWPFRNHGVAHKIVSRLIEEARARGCGTTGVHVARFPRPAGYDEIRLTRSLAPGLQCHR